MLMSNRAHYFLQASSIVWVNSQFPKKYPCNILKVPEGVSLRDKFLGFNVCF